MEQDNDLGASAEADQALAVPAGPVSRPSPTGFDPSRARLLTAFTGKWEQLGSVSARIGGDAWPITAARGLRSEGLLESRYHRNHYEWRLTRAGAVLAIAMETQRAETPKSGSVAKP